MNPSQVQSLGQTHSLHCHFSANVSPTCTTIFNLVQTFHRLNICLSEKQYHHATCHRHTVPYKHFFQISQILSNCCLPTATPLYLFFGHSLIFLTIPNISYNSLHIYSTFILQASYLLSFLLKFLNSVSSHLM